MNPNVLLTVERELERLSDAGLMRRIRPFAGKSSDIVLTDTDYLGLAGDRALRREFLETIDDSLPFSSSASPLLMGESPAHAALEKALIGLYAACGVKDSAVLLFASGWHANTGWMAALGALFQKRLLILADKLVHASMIDGMLAAARHGAVVLRFAHNDLESLERQLARCAHEFEAVLVATESVFSMDGDRAPLAEICALKSAYPHLIVALDEAHGIGVCGQNGAGLAAELGLLDRIDILVGTFGKALASSGAFLYAHPALVKLFANTARPLIFSTADSPVQALWSAFVIGRQAVEYGRRERLSSICRHIDSVLVELGLKHNDAPPSWIVPVVLGTPEAAAAAHAAFLDAGILTSLVRPPTVPAAGSRLRLSLKATLTDQQVERITTALCQFARQEGRRCG